MIKAAFTGVKNIENILNAGLLISFFAKEILRGYAISFLSAFLVGLLRPVLYVVFAVGIVGSIILMKSVDPAGNGILKEE